MRKRGPGLLADTACSGASGSKGDDWDRFDPWEGFRVGYRETGNLHCSPSHDLKVYLSPLASIVSLKNCIPLGIHNPIIMEFDHFFFDKKISQGLSVSCFGW